VAEIQASILKYRWVPIPLYIIIIVFAEINGIRFVKENTILLLILNLVFNTFASFLVIYLLSRSFLINGRIALVLFSCAALIWGLAGPLSAIFGNEDPNTTVTIYNLSVIVAAVLYLSGAYIWSKQKMSIKFPGIWLTVSLFLILVLITLIVILTTSGKTPVFYIEHEGGTRLRYIVLIISTLLFIFTAIILRASSKFLHLSSIYWYSIALGLLSIGFMAIMLQNRMGDFLNWTGRSAQFLGGLYIIIAAFTLVKETNAWERSIEFDLNSKRQLAENALRYKEERYRQIVELAGEAIVITDEKFNITEWNRAAEILYGWTADEVIGKNSRNILRSNIQESELKKLLNDLTEQGMILYEATQHRKDNSIIVIEARLSVIKENNDKISGYIAMNRDITERKKAEQLLRESERRLNIALENANIGLWEWDFRKNELIWDERSERMYGLMPGTFGKTLEAFEDLVNEEDLPRLRTAYKNSIEKGVPYEAIFRIRSDENTRYISAKAFVRKNEFGQSDSMLGVCFDITALKQDSEKAIFKLNEELSRSNRDLENFAYIASHDLQEPLRMVTSFTQLLQQRYSDKLDEDANTFIKYAVDGSKRMYDLINGLLAYSRITTKGNSFMKVDMNEVAGMAVDNLKIRIDESKTIINCHDLPEVFADKNQMMQVLQNLLENAIKFCRQNPVVEISAKTIEDFYVISVKDNGIGIQEAYFDRIFRIFQRLHTTEYKGTGLGLALCRQIIERHGGRIWVESTPGIGSAFSFTMPRT
jgi:PAS domain S-box-containing protein